jgi:lysophospholipase L1-like esterase
MSDIRICFIGESFVNGTGDSTYLGWTGRVCQHLAQQGYPVTYYNLGIRRETSTLLTKRWQSEVERRSQMGSDLRLIFSFGTNDTTIQNGRRRVSLAESLEKTRQILNTAQQRYPVLMVSPPPIADVEQRSRIQELVAELRVVCAELRVPYLDVFTPLLESSVWLKEVIAGDGAHPNSAGYAEFAQLVQQWQDWQDWFES